MSMAFVPGLILLEAPASMLLIPARLLVSSNSETPGEVGPIWSSAMGGGDGSRGEEEGEEAAAIFAVLLVPFGIIKKVVPSAQRRQLRIFSRRAGQMKFRRRSSEHGCISRFRVSQAPFRRSAELEPNPN